MCPWAEAGQGAPYSYAQGAYKCIATGVPLRSSITAKRKSLERNGLLRCSSGLCIHLSRASYTQGCTTWNNCSYCGTRQAVAALASGVRETVCPVMGAPRAQVAVVSLLECHVLALLGCSWRSWRGPGTGIPMLLKALGGSPGERTSSRQEALRRPAHSPSARCLCLPRSSATCPQAWCAALRPPCPRRRDRRRRGLRHLEPFSVRLTTLGLSGITCLGSGRFLQ